MERVEAKILPKGRGQELVEQGVSATDALLAVTDRQPETATDTATRINSAGQVVPVFRLPRS